MSNSLDPDKARCFVRPDMGPDCLQRLSADSTSRQRVNSEWPNRFEFFILSFKFLKSSL